jgi:predicted transcriptional regulator
VGDYAVADACLTSVPQWPQYWYRGGMAMNLRLRDDQQEALKLRAEEEGRSMHAIVLQAIDRYLEQEADRATVRRLGAKYAAGHADLLRRLGE